MNLAVCNANTSHHMTHDHIYILDMTVPFARARAKLGGSIR